MFVSTHRTSGWQLLVCGCVIALLMGCGGHMTVRVKQPAKGQLTLNDKITCRLPCTLKLPTGFHRVVLALESDGQTKRYFGMLHVRPPTENAKLGVVPLTIQPSKLQQMDCTKRVLEAFTYDRSAQLRELLRLRLGTKKPC